MYQRSPYLALKGVSFSYGDHRVLTDVSLTVPPGRRAALVGENGSGKSTLLKLIAGQMPTEIGLTSHPARVGYFAQELEFPGDATVAEVLDDSQQHELDALKALETANEREYARALETAERLDAYRASARRGAILLGLNLSGITGTTPVDHLSGGQRSRLALAAVLLSRPEALVLDEPGNHLDEDGFRFLEQELISFDGPVLLASHDRILLDAVATKIIDLDPSPIPAAVLEDVDVAQDDGTAMGVSAFGGTYTQARRERASLMRRWQHKYASQQQELTRLRHEVAIGARNTNSKDSPRTEARASRKFYQDKDAKVTARRVRSAQSRLVELEENQLRQPPRPLRFAGFRHQEPAGDHYVLAARDLSVPGRLEPLSLAVTGQQKLLITGANGSGKSTLLATLAGELQHQGQLAIMPGVSVGYLPQDAVFENPAMTPRNWFERRTGADGLELVRLGLFAERDLDRELGVLSVGQQRRLALAALVTNPPSLLLLDEPDNHLSLTLVEELEAALSKFSGAVIMVSHDRALIARHREAGLPELKL